MAIERNTYTDILFDALMAAGCTIYGACAAMGNIYAESGANPRNLENLCEKKLNYKYTDDTYTEAVDSGKITRALFLHPLGDSRQYGYGFCQWTSAGRKAGLYDLVIADRNLSAGSVRYLLSQVRGSGECRFGSEENKGFLRGAVFKDLPESEEGGKQSEQN